MQENNLNDLNNSNEKNQENNGRTAEDVNNTRLFPMKYHYFLIYFSLIVGAIYHLFEAFNLISGSEILLRQRYGTATPYLYFPALKTLDVVMAFLFAGEAVFSFIIRNKLANMDSRGPRWLLLSHWIDFAIDLIQNIALTFIVHLPVSAAFDYEFLGQAVATVIFFFCLRTYYHKRACLFHDEQEFSAGSLPGNRQP